VSYQDRVWRIAERAAVAFERQVRGSMLSSSETTCLNFLDGGVYQSQGFRGSSSGMFVEGELATAYVLHRLRLNARRLLRSETIATLAVLETMLEAQRAGSTAAAG
jgi:hypothetical protein